MAYEVILTLSDDSISLAGAQSLCEHLEARGQKVIHLRLIDGCFNCEELKYQDINLTVLGHSTYSQDTQQASYSTKHGDFYPKELVEKLDSELQKANIQPNQLKRVRCLGCEIGLIVDTPILGVKKAAAYSIAENFMQTNYHQAKISTIINYYASGTMGNRLVISNDGSIQAYYVSDSEAEKIKELNKTIKDFEKQLNIEQIKLSKVGKNDPAQSKEIANKILKIRKEINSCEQEIEACGFPGLDIHEPIRWLDEHPSFQISVPQELKPILIDIQCLEQAQHNNTELEDHSLVLESKERITNFLDNQNNDNVFKNYYDFEKREAIHFIFCEVEKLKMEIKSASVPLPPVDKSKKEAVINKLENLIQKVNSSDHDKWQDHIKSANKDKDLSEFVELFEEILDIDSDDEDDDNVFNNNNQQTPNV